MPGITIPEKQISRQVIMAIYIIFLVRKISFIGIHEYCIWLVYRSAKKSEIKFHNILNITKYIIFGLNIIICKGRDVNTL